MGRHRRGAERGYETHSLTPIMPLTNGGRPPNRHPTIPAMLGVTTAAQPHINRPTPVSVLNNFTWPNPAERFTFEADADDTSLRASL